MCSLALTNSWVLYKEIGRNDPLVKFTLTVAKLLIYGTAQSFSDESDDDQQPRSKFLKHPQLTTDIWYDKYNHWPVNLDLPHAQHCKKTVLVKRDINVRSVKFIYAYYHLNQIQPNNASKIFMVFECCVINIMHDKHF